ncbi:MAG: 1-(5-phosphoribosyl)-5-[(5-phosphoribosylamino)methylideneamino]imidazole-4-carboxamide isomerase [Halobacteria archaeon]|nr:1-(5-phosphoribosyl)-5-[(5-phosphoribosylamino)methylideneamino]imidazole-4-carboxamide isomerase [Halobacteria archaeon]
MEVIPAVDIQGGECVQLVQGKEGTQTSYGDPVEAARRWVEEGAELLHLIDLDGAIHGERRNKDPIARIINETQARVQVGGGIRTVNDAVSILNLGVERVIIGTSAVENPEMVETVSEHGNVMVSLDSRGGEVVIEGWEKSSGKSPVELAGIFEEKGAESILYTNVDLEGMLEGVETSSVRRLVETVNIPVVASGGVSTKDDVKALKRAGADGVVVGTAFYEGKLTIEEAKEAAR